MAAAAQFSFGSNRSFGPRCRDGAFMESRGCNRLYGRVQTFGCSRSRRFTDGYAASAGLLKEALIAVRSEDGRSEAVEKSRKSAGATVGKKLIAGCRLKPVNKPKPLRPEAAGPRW
jgi:hypothetical protein